MPLQPPETQFCDLTFPDPNILLVTLNQPRTLNCLKKAGHVELGEVFKWMDETPEITVGVITGSGRAFCAGADLDQWGTTPPSLQGKLPPMGFGGLTFRHGRKPVIAAVNGIALGGGCEMVISCDMVVASKNATLALPDAKVGLTLLGGCLPKLVRTIGRQRPTDMCLTGRTIKAEEAREWGLISQVVESEELMGTALGVARSIAANSPDALIATREGILIGLGAGGAEELGLEFVNRWRGKLVEGENLAEGIKAFRERRKPNWKPSRL